MESESDADQSPDEAEDAPQDNQHEDKPHSAPQVVPQAPKVVESGQQVLLIYLFSSATVHDLQLCAGEQAVDQKVQELRATAALQAHDSTEKVEPAPVQKASSSANLTASSSGSLTNKRQSKIGIFVLVLFHKKLILCLSPALLCIL